MENKKIKLIYWGATGLLTLIMLMSVGMYFAQHDTMVESFSKLRFPSYLIYPLAVAKILGIVAIWTNKSDTLREWAYAGFFYVSLFAMTAHVSANDGEFPPALISMILVLISNVSGKKMQAK